MASTQRSYRDPVSAQSGNLQPLFAPVSVETSRQPAILKALDFHKGRVKWRASKTNYTFLAMDDGREVYLHRDDFDGEWPPRYHKSVKFERLLYTQHKKCAWRAKEAEMLGEKR